jgi:hypothetical protein
MGSSIGADLAVLFTRDLARLARQLVSATNLPRAEIAADLATSGRSITCGAC